ncbi:AraC family transcriptional regulator [Nocardioides immobilis]|uniref:AraC family transcriptional regulator n=1 Tax=Nocardioides immobilis TaxID=2049295 RepID=A0A417XX64_9ACTN|nr:AraC family transcriptional regulator [Nocardioides immobilis]RHW24905.1 AraC family transcriptional regulator [Nocardioides immobilis]
MASLIRATNLWGYSDLVRELGGDPEQLLSRFQLPVSIEQQSDAFIDFRSGARLVESTAVDLDCPDFGLRLSRWQGLDILGPVAVIARNAQTVRDALTAVARFLYVHSPALKLEVAEPSGGSDMTFNYEITERGLPDLRQAYELSTANFSRVVGLLAGPDAHLAAVSFMHQQLGPDSAYEEVLGCPVLFGQPRCEFHLPAGLADKPIDNADQETRRIGTRYLETEFLPHDATFADQVAALSRRLLPVGQATTEAIADELAMHPRSLQRRLAEEGTRCQDIVDDERRKQAVRYLSEPRLYLGQITGMLGFAEQSSLNRACQRWFGMTPREYRAGLPRARSVSD